MQKILIGTIRFYEYFVSPFLGCNCRYHPSCSGFSKEAIQKHGAVKGSLLSIRRICSCHPFREGGYDPVP